MANTARDSTTILGYAELSYKKHDATKVPHRVTAQEFRDSFLSQWQYAQAWLGSSITFTSPTGGSVLTYSEETADAPVSSTDITVSSTAGTFTVGTKGTYLAAVQGHINASTAGGAATKTLGVQLTSTAGSTAQNGTVSLSLSTTPEFISKAWILDVAASKSIDFTLSGTTTSSSATKISFDDGEALILRLK